MAVSDVKLARRDANTVYALIVDSGVPKVYKSTDKGVNWSYKGTVTTDTNYGTLGFIYYYLPYESIYVGLHSTQYYRIYRSKDDGATWTKVKEASTGIEVTKSPIGAFTAGNGNLIFFILTGLAGSYHHYLTLYKTTDNFETDWTLIQGYDYYFIGSTTFDPRYVDAVLLSNGIGIAVFEFYNLNYPSNNFYTQIKLGTNANVLSWDVYSYTGSTSITQLFNEKVFLVNRDTKLYVSTDYGTTFSSKSDLPTAAYKLRALRNNLVLVGQNGSVYISQDEGNNWQQLSGTIPNPADVIAL